MSSFALAAGLRHLRGKLAVRQRSADSDEQLLHAFTSRRDESAFAVLMHRHGPMVLHVCRRVLGHEQDAEDAFQATFLVLAQNAAALRSKTSLASFLHGVAFRTAMKAKQSAIRRRKHEGQAPPRPPADPADELSWREVRALLDEQIARLPEMYQSVFVLCHLEDLSRAEAAQRLGLKECTVLSRLAKARKLLSQRLARRGVELTAMLAAATLATPPASAVPAGLMASTIQAAVATAAGDGLGGIVSASVAELVKGATAAMMVSKAKIATVLLLTAALLAGAGAWTCRTLAISQPVEPSVKTPASPVFLAQARPAETPQREKDASATVTGRVLDPDGKPAVGASVYVHSVAEKERPILSTTTAKNGRFSLVLPRSRLVVPETQAPLRALTIVAMTKGCGPDWQEVPLDGLGREITLHLVKDDVPIQGRILSLEGKPLAGVEVSVQRIMAFPKNDLGRVLQAVREGNIFWHQLTEVRELERPIAERSQGKTDADGRFRLDGIGRDRIARLHWKGPGIHYNAIWAMTQAGESVQDAKKKTRIYAAAFEYLARPSRLICGTVREKDSGKPLPGIHIYSVDTTAHVQTDAQGRYELPGLPKGNRYELMSYADSGAPYFSASIVAKDTPGLAPLTADLEMTRGISCKGKVLDEQTGKPVKGSVEYYPLRPNPYVPDNYGLGGMFSSLSQGGVAVDGSFQCSVLPGPGCLVFRADDSQRFRSACVDAGAINKLMGTKDLLYVSARGGSEVVGVDQARYQAIRLIEPKRDEKEVVQTLRPVLDRPISGIVLNPDGKPLTGVSMSDWETHYRRMEKTLATEKFTIHGVNPLRPRRLYFVYGARHLIAVVEVKGTETEPLAVQLQPWAAVHGRLLDTDGRPLRNAKVGSDAFLVGGACTDDEGRFRLEGLIPSLAYDLTFTCEKNKRLVSGTLAKGFIAKPGEVRDLGDVRTMKTGE
jgi:RNA polymerase sigma factor (sigma-70 family)